MLEKILTELQNSNELFVKDNNLFVKVNLNKSLCITEYLFKFNSTIYYKIVNNALKKGLKFIIYTNCYFNKDFSNIVFKDFSK